MASPGPRSTTRPLTAEDFDQTLALGLEAFGAPPPGSPAPDPSSFPLPGRHSFGTFVDGRLVARVVGREYHSWFHGVEVATCGIAGVTVVAEHRGRGLLAKLFAEVLADGRSRGEVVSTLFPTAPGIYRRFGYEVVGSYDTVEVPTAELSLMRPPERVRTRRAQVEDVPAVRRVHDAWAARQNGPLTRRGPSFPESDEEIIGDVTGITIAVDEHGDVVGYAAWERGRGYGAEAALDVWDLVGLEPDAHRALWRVLGSFASVAATVRLRTSGTDAARLVLPTGGWRTVQEQPYMLRVDDVAGAFSLLPPRGREGVRLELAVAGDALGVLDGGYRVEVTAAGTSCERAEVGAEAPVLTPTGLALAWAGAQSAGNLRLVGHLAGGSTATDDALDLLLGGRQLHVRDYF